MLCVAHGKWDSIRYALCEQTIHTGIVGAGYGITLVTQSQAHVRIPSVMFRHIREENAEVEVQLAWVPENGETVFAASCLSCAKCRLQGTFCESCKETAADCHAAERPQKSNRDFGGSPAKPTLGF